MQYNTTTYIHLSFSFASLGFLLQQFIEYGKNLVKNCKNDSIQLHFFLLNFVFNNNNNNQTFFLLSHMKKKKN